MKEESPPGLEYHSAFLFTKFKNMRELFEELNPFHIDAPSSSDALRILTPEEGPRPLTVPHSDVILSRVCSNQI